MVVLECGPRKIDPPPDKVGLGSDSSEVDDDNDFHTHVHSGRRLVCAQRLLHQVSAPHRRRVSA